VSITRKIGRRSLGGPRPGPLARPARAFLRRRDGERGTTLIEFAFMAPLFFMLSYASIEFGRLIFIQGVLLYAAEEATRFAVVNYDATAEEIRAVAESRLLMVNPDKITHFIVEAPIDPVDQTKLITIDIGYGFEFMTSLVRDEPVQLSAASRGFIYEQ